MKYIGSVFAILVCSTVGNSFAAGAAPGEKSPPGTNPRGKIPAAPVEIPGAGPIRPGLPPRGGNGHFPPRPGSDSDRRPEILRRFDADGNGRLDDAEREKLVEDMKRRGLRKEEIARQMEHIALLERFDANGDGRLDEQEAAAMREALRNGAGPPDVSAPDAKKRKLSPKQAEYLKKYDTDGDGKLSNAEKLAAQRETKAERDAESRRKADGKKAKN